MRSLLVPVSDGGVLATVDGNPVEWSVHLYDVPELALSRYSLLGPPVLVRQRRRRRRDGSQRTTQHRGHPGRRRPDDRLLHRRRGPAGLRFCRRRGRVAAALAVVTRPRHLPVAAEPWLLFGLLGGALADRVDRRRAMWTVDVVRGVLVAGFATAPPSASARLMTGQALAGAFLGAPAAGLLVSAGVALPFAVDAATYLVAAALIASLPRPARWRGLVSVGRDVPR